MFTLTKAGGLGLLLSCFAVLIHTSEGQSPPMNANTNSVGKAEDGVPVPYRVVRNLRISKNPHGCLRIGRDRDVCFLELHPNSSSLDLSKNYLGFTLYNDQRGEVLPGGGVLHFVDSMVAYRHSVFCSPDFRTWHAGAYHYFYGKCPEDEQNLVASGYCYFGSPPDGSGQGLDFSSGTFNTAWPSYVDKRYYLNNNRRMHSTEIDDLRHCFAQWHLDGFAVSAGWRCNFPATRGQRGSDDDDDDDEELRRLAPIRPLNPGGCNECECLSSLGRPDLNAASSGRRPGPDRSLAVIAMVIVIITTVTVVTNLSS